MYTINVELEINYNTKKIRPVDNTDYSNLDFANITVTGEGTILAPDGSTLATGSLIDISGGDTSGAWVPLPTDNLGNILPGTYQLLYAPRFQVNGYAVSSFAATPNRIIVDQDWSDVLAQPDDLVQVTIAGATTPANDGIKNLVAPKAEWDGSETTITVSEAITAEAGGSATITFDTKYSTNADVTVTYTTADIKTPCITATYDCDSTRYGQIIFQDTTELPAGSELVSRAWVISYPNGLTDPATPPDVTSSAPSVTINTLASGVWTALLTHTVQVTQDDGLIYTYVKTSKATTVSVSCAGSFCALLSAMKDYFGKLAGAVACGQQSPYGDQATVINGYYAIAVEAKKCGDAATYQEYYAKIKALLGSCVTTECGGCSGDCSGSCSGGCTNCSDGCSGDADCGCTCSDSVRWIDNGTDVFGDDAENSAIFSLTTPVSAGANLAPATTVLPTSAFGTVAVNPIYFDFGQALASQGEVYGKRFVDVEYEIYSSGNNGGSTLTIGGTQMYSTGFNEDETGSVAFRIGTKASGNSTVFCIQGVVKKTSVLGAVTVNQYYYELTDPITSDENLNIVHATSGSSPNNTLVFMAKVTPFKVS